jgi:hypothetical protein
MDLLSSFESIFTHHTTSQCTALHNFAAPSFLYMRSALKIHQYAHSREEAIKTEVAFPPEPQHSHTTHSFAGEPALHNKYPKST